MPPVGIDDIMGKPDPKELKKLEEFARHIINVISAKNERIDKILKAGDLDKGKAIILINELSNYGAFAKKETGHIGVDYNLWEALMEQNQSLESQYVQTVYGEYIVLKKAFEALKAALPGMDIGYDKLKELKKISQDARADLNEIILNESGKSIEDEEGMKYINKINILQTLDELDEVINDQLNTKYEE